MHILTKDHTSNWEVPLKCAYCNKNIDIGICITDNFQGDELILCEKCLQEAIDIINTNKKD